MLRSVKEVYLLILILAFVSLARLCRVISVEAFGAFAQVNQHEGIFIGHTADPH